MTVHVTRPAAARTADRPASTDRPHARLTPTGTSRTLAAVTVNTGWYRRPSQPGTVVRPSRSSGTAASVAPYSQTRLKTIGATSPLSRPPTAPPTATST